MRLRGILVARVSNKDQASEGHYSLDAQLRFMRECCQRRGIEIVDERVEGGQSAFTADLRQLPVLHQTLLDIEAGTANALVMHESSRLARNEQLANHLLDRLIECGAAFVNSTIDIDYATPEGRVFFNNEATMNAYVSRKTSQHAKKGKLEQFLKGLPVGKIPFGYESQVGGDGRNRRDLPPVQIPKEAALIQKAFQDRALRRSPNEIAREWNALGFRPRSVQGVQQFGQQTVRAILQNPFHMGYVQHLGERRKGLHRPIVLEDEWYAAQHPMLRITRRRYPPLLLQGVADCARCGRALYPSRPRRGPADSGEHYSYYRESSPDSNRECPDSGRMWSSEKPDALVDELVRTLTVSQEWLDHVLAEAARFPERCDARRRDLEETRKRIQREYFSRRLDEKEYGKLRRDCNAELALLPSSRPDLDKAAARFQSFGAMWTTASAEARNDTCRLIFEKVILDMQNHTFEVCPTPEFQALFQLRRSFYASAISPEPDSPLSADSETPIPRS